MIMPDINMVLRVILGGAVGTSPNSGLHSPILFPSIRYISHTIAATTAATTTTVTWTPFGRAAQI